MEMHVRCTELSVCGTPRATRGNGIGLQPSKVAFLLCLFQHVKQHRRLLHRMTDGDRGWAALANVADTSG